MVYSINLYVLKTGRKVSNLKAWDAEESDLSDSLADWLAKEIEKRAPPPDGCYVAWTRASIG